MTIRWVNSDAGAGLDDGTSEANGYLTIAQAMAAVAAGDHVWVKLASGYAEAATISTGGSFSAPITYEGYNATTGDEGIAVIDGSSANNYGIRGNATSAYHIFKNLKVINSTGDGFIGETSTDDASFINCHADNCVVGFQTDNDCRYLRCTSSNNSGVGIECGNKLFMHSCEVFGNGGHGAQGAFDMICVNSVFYSPATSKIMCNSLGGFLFGSNNTFDGEAVTGAIGMQMATWDHVVVNNLIYDCVSGLKQNGTNAPNIVGFNLINSNTTDYDGIENNADNDVTGAPQFTAEATPDYTLAVGSPAIDAGSDASNAP